MKKTKLSLENLEKLFNKQLNDLKKLGCSSSLTEELRAMKNLVLAMSYDLPGNYHFPFLPVLPEHYLNVYRKMFLNKNGINLAIKRTDYSGWKYSDSPYYLIGVKIPNQRDKTISESGGANLTEIISLSLLSGLSGPFYAHRSRYVITGNDKTEKTITSANTGVWLNIGTGAIGPFIKDIYPATPAIQIFGRFPKSS
jgi:hypothetical protein